jgi:hypothetical protein
VKTLLPALAFAALPAAAFANCSTAELRICVLDSPSLDQPLVRPCAVAQCATETAVFEYFGLSESNYARVDITGDITGTMNADFGAIGPGGQEMVYEALQVDLIGTYTYGREGRVLFYTLPCNDTCAGEDPNVLIE